MKSNPDVICLACSKAGEYTAALWLLDHRIVVKASFRAHGHGEFDLAARVPGGEWVDVVEGLNCDFGRECDHIVQGLVQGDQSGQSLLLEIAKVYGVEISNGDQALEFQNWLMDVLFAPIYEGVVAAPSEGIRQFVDGWRRDGVSEEDIKKWVDGAARSEAVMNGPDFIRVPHIHGLKYNCLHEAALGEFVVDFIYGLCDSGDAVLAAALSNGVNYLMPGVLLGLRNVIDRALGDCVKSSE
jgi:hypothetical protein